MMIYKAGGTFLCRVERLNNYKKFLGLMFRKELSADSGVLMERGSAQFLHSFFVFFSFHVIFLDDEFRVVEEFIMKPFQVKRAKGEWVLETTPKQVKKGDRLVISYCSS